MRETRYTRLQSRSSGLESTALKSHIPVPGPVTARQDTIVVVLLAVVPSTALWTDFRESASPKRQVSYAYATSRHNRRNRPDERAHGRTGALNFSPNAFTAHGRRQAKPRRYLA